jgi:hypothetical protein
MQNEDQSMILDSPSMNPDLESKHKNRIKYNNKIKFNWNNNNKKQINKRHNKILSPLPPVAFASSSSYTSSSLDCRMEGLVAFFIYSLEDLIQLGT